MSDIFGGQPDMDSIPEPPPVQVGPDPNDTSGIAELARKRRDMARRRRGRDSVVIQDPAIAGDGGGDVQIG